MPQQLPPIGAEVQPAARAALPPIGAEVSAAPGPEAPDWIDKVADWLPTIGGTLVGAAGAAAGNIPGAIAGATAGGMMGETYKTLIARARGRGPKKTIGATAMDIGTEGLKQGAAEAVGGVVAPAARMLGRRFMQSAVKPGLKSLLTAARTGETPRVVQTLLDEGVNVTPGGVAKLQTLLKSTNDEIAEAIRTAPGSVKPLIAVGRLSETAKKFGQQVNPQDDLAAISQVGDNFLAAHGGAPLSLPQAQALKVGTYARIGEKYGKSGAASIEAEKAIARGLKEEIAKEVPVVAGLNAREGRLLEALDVTGRRVALSGNRDPVGFAWAAHNPTTFLAALMDRNPAVKSLLGRGLYNVAGKAARVHPALIRTAMVALSTDDPDAAMSATSTDQESR